MKQVSAILGCSGLRLSADEKDFFRELNPWGFILSARNIESKTQLVALVDDFRQAVGRDDVPVLIDQEGGRVCRLPSPEWRRPPAPAIFPALYTMDPGAALEATYLNYRLIAHDLKTVGVNVNCAPMLDVPAPNSHEIIGDRALGESVKTICVIGREVVSGLTAGGVAPVIKHGPGHGRAVVDSHLSLPRVAATHDDLSAIDFAPFKAFNKEAMLMTAHVIYEAIDNELPATISPTVIKDILRGECGFDGLIMTDDLNMQALSGNLEERATAALAAGCDMLLQCNGVMDDMQEVARAAVTLDGKALERTDAAEKAAFKAAEAFDAEEASERLAILLRGDR